ncbi:MAG: hypothetical protein IPH46_00935 [Bacteroidetes bacterium]|nr:hypothetical protein [Bacteroidota bacterium]
MGTGSQCTFLRIIAAPVCVHILAPEEEIVMKPVLNLSEVSETDQELKTCKGQRRNNFCCTFMLLLQLYELSKRMLLRNTLAIGALLSAQYLNGAPALSLFDELHTLIYDTDNFAESSADSVVKRTFENEQIDEYNLSD